MKKVLIIEDEEAILAVLKAVVIRAKMQVTACETLASGQSYFDHSYDLLIVDISLPDGSGLEFVKSVREGGYEGRIILMTGHTDIDTTELAIDHLLFKPFSMQTLLKLLDQ